VSRRAQTLKIEPQPIEVVHPFRSARAKRLVADVPEATHRAVRLRCAQRGIQIRDYLLELLRKDGIL